MHARIVLQRRPVAHRERGVIAGCRHVAQRQGAARGQGHLLPRYTVHAGDTGHPRQFGLYPVFGLAVHAPGQFVDVVVRDFHAQTAAQRIRRDLHVVEGHGQAANDANPCARQSPGGLEPAEGVDKARLQDRAGGITVVPLHRSLAQIAHAARNGQRHVERHEIVELDVARADGFGHRPEAGAKFACGNRACNIAHREAAMQTQHEIRRLLAAGFEREQGVGSIHRGVRYHVEPRALRLAQARKHGFGTGPDAVAQWEITRQRCPDECNRQHVNFSG